MLVLSTIAAQAVGPPAATIFHGQREEKMSTTRIASIILFLAFAKPAVAQAPIINSCPADAPVSLQVAAIKSDAELASVTITNKSPKPLSAILLRWKVTDSKGMVTPVLSTVDFATSGALLPPGKLLSSEEDVSVGHDGSLTTVEVTCAAVLFSGKGIWGDNSMPEISRLLAIRKGIRSERARLLCIYQKQGSKQLLQELKRPVVQ
jgi:hypothetical protein